MLVFNYENFITYCEAPLYVPLALLLSETVTSGSLAVAPLLTVTISAYPFPVPSSPPLLIVTLLLVTPLRLKWLDAVISGAV